jgi:hypothetical protein
MKVVFGKSVLLCVWIHLAQWQAVVNTVMNLLVPYMLAV